MPAVLEAIEAKVIQADELHFSPHPKFKGVEIAYLLTRKDDDVNMTTAIVHWNVGAEIPEHTHEDSDDILYILRGKARIWIDGVGDIPLRAGTFVRVPKGVRHHPYDIEEDLLAHDTWFPAAV